MAKKTNNYRFLGGLAVAFVLPLSFYFIARVMSKDKLHMPHYYIAEGIKPVHVKGKNDTLYHQVADLQLTNQLGALVSLNKDLKGKILIVDFFFVNCPTICPRLTNNMKLLQKAFHKNPKMESSLDTAVQLISITVNPAHDSFPLLRSYADRYQVDHDHWWFLTGDKKVIYNYARNQLFVETAPGDGGADDFVHTQKIVVLDQNRHIRGYYDGLDIAEIKRCADDVVLLSLEK
jgi:protein SCO1/2